MHTVTTLSLSRTLALSLQLPTAASSSTIFGLIVVGKIDDDDNDDTDDVEDDEEDDEDDVDDVIVVTVVEAVTQTFSLLFLTFATCNVVLDGKVGDVVGELLTVTGTGANATFG